MPSSSGNAIVWSDWRVEAITLDHRQVLKICRGPFLIGYTNTITEALRVLDRHGVPIDQLTRELARPLTDDRECE